VRLALGHGVTAREIEIADVGAVTARFRSSHKLVHKPTRVHPGPRRAQGAGIAGLRPGDIDLSGQTSPYGLRGRSWNSQLMSPRVEMRGAAGSVGARRAI
jgi:hypothetical protein